jgi:uridine phosphorylase
LHTFVKSKGEFMTRIAESELILNPDGSIYHLKLKPEDLGEIVLLVGDPGRVQQVSAYFEKIELKVQNREFVTHTGIFNGKRISAVSTGIGTDNIDIVLNELDALVNIDLVKREVKKEHIALQLVRIGTSGALQADIPVDSVVLSLYGIGFDGLMNFYEDTTIFEKEITESFIKQSGWKSQLNYPYVVKGSEMLANKLREGAYTGITATACGFYGPQGRVLRLQPAMPDMNEKLTAFEHGGLRITNFEMETSALYGLSASLGHHAATVCAIIANRIAKQYSKDYHVTVEKLIRQTLENLTK